MASVGTFDALVIGPPMNDGTFAFASGAASASLELGDEFEGAWITLSAETATVYINFSRGAGVADNTVTSAAGPPVAPTGNEVIQLDPGAEKHYFLGHLKSEGQLAIHLNHIAPVAGTLRFWRSSGPAA